MAEGFQVTFQLGDSPLVQPGAALAIITRRMSEAVRQGILAWSAQATLRTPVGVSGNLRSGYSTRIRVTRPLAITGQLLNVVPYFEPVEQGARPHWPPWGPGSALARWARVKLGNADLAFLVARSIARGTTRGTAIRGVHMARTAFRMVTPLIGRNLRGAWRRVTQELSASR